MADAPSLPIDPRAAPQPISSLRRDTAGGTESLKDVWSWPGSKYRLRAIGLLALNIVLFAGTGCFAYWLRSGAFFAPGREGYWDLLAHTFRGVGRADVSLGALLIGPISAQDVPILIPIVGLLMASLIAIPILVAILYRFWSSLPFIAVVGLLAVMPWLALTLLGSCVLASVRPFRTRFRFMSALIGLVPCIVYLALAWKGTWEIVVGRIDPVDAVKFVAPWVLAVVAAAMLFAVVLAIAKLVNYRPGAVTPLLALMFGLPVAMFELHVGRDELYYRLLEQLDGAYFADVDASADWTTAVALAWQRHPLPRPSWEAIRQTEEQKWLFGLGANIGPYESELTPHQAEVAHRCDWFQRFFPDSRYLPNVLYIKARSWDQRVDLEEFRRTKWIRFYDDFPNVASRETWTTILVNRPTTPVGAVARLRLAQLEAREGDVDRAAAKLAELIDVYRRPATDRKAAAATEETLLGADTDPEAGLNVRVDRVLLEAHRLHSLLTSNNDPLYGFDPLSGPRQPTAAVWFGLLDLDPRDGRYVANLKALQAAYPRCQIEDNLELEIARSTPGPRGRIVILESLLERFPDRDAAPEALVRLAMAYRRTQQPLRSAETLAALGVRFRNSIWAQRVGDFAPLMTELRPGSEQP
ncbi:MAG: hypothetical protein AABZ12_13145 [Planctomycetota bacterium]